MKVRIYRKAAQHGLPGIWTSDDVEAALQEGNCTLRPLGTSGPTPEQLWHRRKPIPHADREEFAEAIRRAHCQILEENGMHGEQILPEPRIAVARQAMRRALIELGY